ncbi:hypothetical protein ES703_94236 [subsurface metagenome]
MDPEKLHWVNIHKGPKNDYILLDDEFLKAMHSHYFGPNQHKVLWYLLRKTWGEGKRSEFIRVMQCAEELEIPKQRVSEALSSLVKRRIVTKLGNKRYEIQADTSLWYDRDGRQAGENQGCVKESGVFGG